MNSEGMRVKLLVCTTILSELAPQTLVSSLQCTTRVQFKNQIYGRAFDEMVEAIYLEAARQLPERSQELAGILLQLPCLGPGR